MPKPTTPDVPLEPPRWVRDAVQHLIFDLVRAQLEPAIDEYKTLTYTAVRKWLDTCRTETTGDELLMVVAHQWCMLSLAQVAVDHAPDGWRADDFTDSDRELTDVVGDGEDDKDRGVLAGYRIYAAIARDDLPAAVTVLEAIAADTAEASLAMMLSLADTAGHFIAEHAREHGKLPQIDVETPDGDLRITEEEAATISTHGPGLYLCAAYVPDSTNLDALVIQAHDRIRETAASEPDYPPLCGVHHHETIAMNRLPAGLREFAARQLRESGPGAQLLHTWQHHGPCPECSPEDLEAELTAVLHMDEGLAAILDEAGEQE